MKRVRISSNKFIFFVVIILLAIFAYVVIIILNNYHLNSQRQSNSENIQNIDYLTAVKAAEIIEISDSRKIVEVPVLMYHHIREYDVADDQIGTNLSVSANNFKEQLDYLKNNSYTTITFSDLIDFPVKKLPDKPVIITLDDGYSDAYENAFKLLKSNRQIAVFYIISSFIDNPEYLSKENMVEISDAGMEIASHTVTHRNLTKLAPEDLKKEIINSKIALEEIVGRKIISFCYPAGKYDQIVSKEVINAGYLTATTTQMAVSNTSEDKFLIPRLRITPSDSITSFANKINNY